MSASAYYQRKQAPPSQRAQEDERLLGHVREVHQANYEAYGYRRTWKALRRAGASLPGAAADAPARHPGRQARRQAVADHQTGSQRRPPAGSRDSRNSSQPPSQDPPKSRAERRREARTKLKELSRRKPGGQPGHEGKHRQMAPAEQVDRRTEHLPKACSCGHSFDGSEQRVPDPVVHQQWELPPIRPLIFQHELHRLRCPCCGKPRLAGLPEGVTWSAFAPRWRPTSRRWRGSFACPAARCARSSRRC